MKILFVTAEAWPLAKTGGLGDVAYGLTCALADRGHDVRLLMPAYPSARERLEGPIKYLSLGSGAGSVKGQAQTSSTKGQAQSEGQAQISQSEGQAPGGGQAQPKGQAPTPSKGQAQSPAPSKGQAQSSNRYHKQKIIEGRLPGSEVSVWLLDDPELFERVGSPYATASGEPWPDNHLRFYWLSRVAAAIAAGEVLDWQADILHANDWQSALAPVFLQDYSESHQERPRTVFSIHNLAYRGIFSADVFAQLELPAAMWNPERLEFYGELAFIKGALTLSDAITTVSPTYAREIQTPAFGWGLDGLLRSRSSDLHGIINGVDTTTWDPATDPHLAANYSAPDPQAKAKNRQAIAVEIGLDDDPQSPLLGFIGRLVEQKGIDLILGALPRLLASGARLAILGSGDNTLERALLQAAQAHPGRVGVSIGYDEGQAHRIEAGSDIFLMPSRFEPCGLNQLYSLRYGTPPLVNPTGGLADTVLDVDAHAGGNGFCTAAADAGSLAATVERALSYWQDQEAWQKIQARGMSADYSWDRSADAYVDLYERIRATGWQRR